MAPCRLCFLLICLQPGLQNVPASQIVGSWRYDLKTLKLNFSPSIRKLLPRSGSKSKDDLGAFSGSIRKVMGHVTITFSPDKSISVTMDSPKLNVKGKWWVTGHKVNTVMYTSKQTVPSLDYLDASGRILAKFEFKKVGTGSAELVRR